MLFHKTMLLSVLGVTLGASNILCANEHAEATPESKKAESTQADTEDKQKLVEMFVAKCAEGYLSSEKPESVTQELKDTATKQCHCLATTSPIIDDMMNEKDSDKMSETDITKKYGDYITKCATADSHSPTAGKM